MIVNSKDILLKAKKNKYAIPHFNTNNLEWTRFILEECNKMNIPVIIGVSESSIKYMGGYKVVVDLIKDLDEALKIKIPVVIHLDHGSSFESVKKAIDNGFTSVMIDASRNNLDENINITKKVVEYAKKFDVTVEAEIGIIGGKEESIEKNTIYTKVEEVMKFVKETNIDSLAPSIGNAHGIYKEKPNLNFKLIKEINKLVNIPLVLHGASGISDEEIKKCISAGVTKVNINTDLNLAWYNSVKKFMNNNNVYDVRKIILSGEDALKQCIKHKIIVLRNT